MSVPTLSLVVPWRGGKPQREESLRNMLNCLVACNKHIDKTNYEVLIVEHPAAAKDGYARIKELVPEGTRNWQYIALPHGPAFNKSWCMNVGARSAAHDRLVFVDADSLFGSKYLVTISHYVGSIPEPNNKVFLCWNFIAAMPGKDNPVCRHLEPHMLNTLGGIWCADRTFYFDVMGGMNENFAGYGGEDNEAYVRAAHFIGCPLSYIAYPLVHQYHDWEAPSKVATLYFEIARDNPVVVSERLRSAGVGKVGAPTIIEMDDLR